MLPSACLKPRPALDIFSVSIVNQAPYLALQKRDFAPRQSRVCLDYNFCNHYVNIIFISPNYIIKSSQRKIDSIKFEHYLYGYSRLSLGIIFLIPFFFLDQIVFSLTTDPWAIQSLFLGHPSTLRDGQRLGEWALNQSSESTNRNREHSDFI